MAINFFKDDLLARKTVQFVLIVDLVFLFIAVLLVFFGAPFIALALAFLTFLLFIGVFLWLYIRYNTLPVVREKKNLQRICLDLQGKINNEIKTINQSTQKQKQLAAEEKREKELTLSKLQEDYIKNGLLNTKVDSAKIPGVGPKLKEKLIVSGIVSAAHINQNISTMGGFGASKTHALLLWKQTIYEALINSQPAELPVEVFDNITRKYLGLQEENVTLLNSAKEKEELLNGELRTATHKLNALSKITYIAYLLEAFSSQKLVSILIFSTLVLVPCVMGGGTSTATIIASIPTFTFTPTGTFTPTFTYTPMITYTPTITLTPTITFTPTITNTPTITPTLTNTFTPQPTLPINIVSCIPQGTTRETGLVIGIVDGDTIDVRINNQTYRVRYIGIDTPERNEPFYNLATAYNQQLVFNKNVTLVKDVSETDSFDRILRYIIVDNTLVNYELVRQGYAEASSYPPDTACDGILRNTQQQAQSEKLGMWMPTPTPYVPPASDGNCHPSYPGVCIPPPPPDLDCGEIVYRRFQVLPPDPHNFDGDGDGIGCES